MKRIISIILVFSFCLCICNVATAEFTEFDFALTDYLTNELDYTPATWFSTAENRAILTVLLNYELWASEQLSMDYYELTESAVCQYKDRDDLLIVFFCGYSNTLAVMYSPQNSSYALMEKVNFATIEDDLKSMGTIYANSEDDIKSALLFITSVMPK